MNELYDKIRHSGGGYFSESEIDTFIQFISKWEKHIISGFYQITQAGDKARLEFGAHAGPMLIDVVVEKGHVSVCMLPISQISLIRLEEIGDTTHLVIEGTSNQTVLSYVAATEDFRVDLRKYWDYLQSLLSNR